MRTRAAQVGPHAPLALCVRLCCIDLLDPCCCQGLVDLPPVKILLEAVLKLGGNCSSSSSNVDNGISKCGGRVWEQQGARQEGVGNC
jgi:hypothetical protein